MKKTLAFMLPVIAALFIFCLPAASDELGRKPTFRGGDAGDFSLWVAQNVVYPKDAFEQGIEGSVMVSFVIDTDGSVSDVKVLRSVNELLDAEAVRVISSSPKWEPGTKDGSPVKVSYQIPVTFNLKAERLKQGKERLGVEELPRSAKKE